MTLLLTATLAVAVYTLITEVTRKKKKQVKVLPPRQKISRMNTLLYNIEVYDGTSKGQKKIGGDRI